MAAGSQKNEREKLRRRKKNLFKKAYELGKLCDIDVAVILYKNVSRAQASPWQQESL